MQGSEFERLYAEHAESLLAFLVYRLGDRAQAEDVLSDTFERVIRKRWRFDPRRGSEKTGLYAIALNLVRDDARRRGAEIRALEQAAALVPVSVGGGYDTVDDRAQLETALASISERDRELLALRYGGDLTLPEIAKLTCQPEPTVRGRLYRALSGLRDALE